MVSSQQKKQVMEILQSLNSGDLSTLSYFSPYTYCEHNLLTTEGDNSFLQLIHIAQQTPIKIEVMRIFVDGNYVVSHSQYNFSGQRIVFDIFRFYNGKIVEHWDNTQIPPTKTNPSKHTMLDGVTKINHQADRGKNKQLVSEFLSEVIMQQHFDKMSDYISVEQYIQHNPYIADGLAGLREAFKSGLSLIYDKVHLILGEGDFVLSVSEGYLNDEYCALYDLFRIAEGKIVEHWDVIETIPEEQFCKNQNGKF